jgi:glycosyltransferase involved in cell wall biosynthesis
MTTAPLVSIIAPAHNAAGFLRSWIASIESQEYQPIEAILIDDGSTDALAELVASGPQWIRYFRQDNRGPAAARNAALEKARGDLIAFLDLDDVWDPGHLSNAVEALERNPDAGIAQGLIRNAVSETKEGLYYCSPAYRFLNLGASVFRRSVFTRCGVFNTQLRFAEDYDLITRCWEQGIRKIDLDTVSLLYHRHPGNMTHGKSPVELGAIVVYKLHLDRVRSGQALANPRGRVQVSFPHYIGRVVIPHDQGIREPVSFGGGA